MNKAWVLVLVVLAISAAVGATTVDHGWSGDAYVIRIHDIDDAPANGYLLPTFYVVNAGRWEIVRDTVNDAIVLTTGAHAPLDEAEIEVTFNAYEELKLTLPAAFVATGDEISVYVMWIDDEEPVETFTVEEGGPEDAASASLFAGRFYALVPVRLPLPLEITAHAIAGGGAGAMLQNLGTGVSQGTLKVTATLSYYRDWVGETVTRFLDHTLGRILLAPDAGLELTVLPGTTPEERYVVTFLDLIDRTSGEPLVVSVPPPSDKAVTAFKSMIYDFWTGLVDKEPEADYIDLGFGFPGVHLYFPIDPYFPPPR